MNPDNPLTRTCSSCRSGFSLTCMAEAVPTRGYLANGLSGVKRTLGLLAVSTPALAHHTKEHTMATQPPQQIIAETKQGEGGESMGWLWVVVIVIFALGAWNWLKK